MDRAVVNAATQILVRQAPQAADAVADAFALTARKYDRCSAPQRQSAAAVRRLQGAQQVHRSRNATKPFTGHVLDGGWCPCLPVRSACGDQARSRRHRSANPWAKGDHANCDKVHMTTAGGFDVENAVKVMRGAGLEPLVAYPGAREPWRCRCTTCGYEVAPRYNNVQQRGTGCGRCGVARRGLARRIPEDEAVAVMRAVGLEPLAPYPGDCQAPWRSRCGMCGEVVSPGVSTVKARGRSCWRCAIARRGLARRLPEADAIASMRAADLEPLDPYPGSALVPWRCRCLTCGGEVRPRLGDIRSKKQGGCNPCGIARRSAALRVPEAKALVVMRAADLEPLEPYPGSNKASWRCRCLTCNDIVLPSYAVIVRGQGGCTECGRRRGGLARRVSEGEAIAIMRAASFEPLEPYPTSGAPWRCRCLECGTESAPTLTNVKGGRRCRGCATYGLNPSAPASIYLVVNARHNAVKIGIMNVGSDRINEHRRNGWEALVIDEEPFVWPVPTGRQAESIEHAILRVWRERLGADPAVAADDMPQGGFTETASLTLVDPDLTAMEIVAMVDALGHNGMRTM